MQRIQMVWDSPIGMLRIAAEGEHCIGMYFPDHHPSPRFWDTDAASVLPGQVDVLDRITDQLQSYFQGDSDSGDVACRLIGTTFQMEVWRQLKRIPFGETATYSQIADRIGRPKAVRAVGAAVGRNPISILVPCHRVIGSTGKMTGFAGGLERKMFLLDLESSMPVETQRQVFG